MEYQCSKLAQGLISQMICVDPQCDFECLTADSCEWLLHHLMPPACASSFLYLCSNVSLPSKRQEKRAKSLTDSVNFISGEKYQEHDFQLQAQLTRTGTHMNDVWHTHPGVS